MDNRDYKYNCDGKCRICPFPGALCKEKITIEPDPISHRRDDNVVYLDEELFKELRKHLGG